MNATSIAPAVLPAAEPVSYTACPKRVLVVEDHIDSARTLAFLVGQMGHKAEYAINGYVAVDVARVFRPNVVLLDLGMPGMDGYEVCRRLKRDPRLNARVIVISAYGDEEHRARARAAGCELHLSKPVSPTTLFELLERPASGQ
jgi:CheY-like chemotaxis protein